MRPLFLLEGLAFGVTPIIRFCCKVLCLVYAHHAFLLECLMLAHACCLPRERQTGRLAGGCVPIPPWVGIAGSAFSDCRCGYRGEWVHFGFMRFFVAIPTERRGERGTKWRRGVGAFCGNILALQCFPWGERWGLRVPRPAPKSHWLSGLSSFDSRCGCVSRGKGLSGTTKA